MYPTSSCRTIENIMATTDFFEFMSSSKSIDISWVVNVIMCVIHSEILKKNTKDDHLKTHLITTKEHKQSDDVERNKLNK